jgi:hypothetical protein
MITITLLNTLIQSIELSCRAHLILKCKQLEQSIHALYSQLYFLRQMKLISHGVGSKAYIDKIWLRSNKKLGSTNKHSI